MHAAELLRRLIAGDTVKGMAAPRMIKDLCTEPLGQHFPHLRISTSRLAGTEKPVQSQFLCLFPCEFGASFNKVLSKGGCGHNGHRRSQPDKIKDPFGPSFDAHGNRAGPEVHDPLGKGKPAGEHAEREGLDHHMARSDSRPPILSGMHLADHVHVMLGQRPEGGDSGGA